MGIVTKLQSRIGFARADITVLLFIAGAFLLGFIYTTFFESRTTLGQRHDLVLLTRRHDSIAAARRNAQTKELERTIAEDTIAEWQPLTASDQARDSAAEPPKASGGRKELPTEPVNINTAGKPVLMRLPGVGEKTADAIIALREHLPFRRAEDIMNVKGIGEKKFEKMRSFIRIK